MLLHNLNTDALLGKLINESPVIFFSFEPLQKLSMRFID